MGYKNDGKNLMLDALGEAIIYVGLLDETDTELTGGNPAYERKAITWKPADAGLMEALNQPEFNIPAGATVSKVIFMSADTGGIKYAEADVDDEVFTKQGTYTLISITLDLNAE